MLVAVVWFMAPSITEVCTSRFCNRVWSVSRYCRYTLHVVSRYFFRGT